MRILKYVFLKLFFILNLIFINNSLADNHNIYETLEVIKNESFELNIKMPLVESLYNIIYEELTPSTLISDLVNNPHEVDVEFKY